MLLLPIIVHVLLGVATVLQAMWVGNYYCISGTSDTYCGADYYSSMTLCGMGQAALLALVRGGWKRSRELYS